MIEYLEKGKARLIVNIGSGKNRKRKTKTVTYKTKRELKKLYDQFEEEVHAPPLTRVSVTELVQSYIRHCKASGCKETTTLGYEVALKRIQTLTDGILATSLTTYQLEEIIAQMSDNRSEPYSPKTIANTVRLVSAAYERGIRLGQLDYNPCKTVSLPRGKKKEPRTFSEEEILRFMDALKSERIDYRVGYELCLFCGMRKSEVLGLTEADISIPFKQLSVHHTRHYVNGTNIESDTKTARSRRRLAVPDFVIEDIKALIEEHNSYDFETCDYLIQDGFGQPMQSATFTNHIKRIEKNNDLPLVSVHGLRHTFATMLNAEGIDIARISAELGHSNITTTLNVYTHVFGSASASSRGIADAINAKIRKSATNLPHEANEKASER